MSTRRRFSISHRTVMVAMAATLALAGLAVPLVARRAGDVGATDEAAGLTARASLIGAALLLGVAALLALWSLLDLLAERRRRAKLQGEVDREIQGKWQNGFGQLLNVYDKPWYIVCGEPAVGKTAALRAAKLPMAIGPDGAPITDPKQGEGGTLMFDWWFYEDAVVLDSAGDLIANPDQRWVAFLERVRAARPVQPINGMLLAISATDLLGDPRVLREKAALLGRQVEVARQQLRVRFPLYLLVTKSDLITGFADFFPPGTDLKSASQILGWSNPQDPRRDDRPAVAAEVRRAVDGLIESLRVRRTQTLARATSARGDASSRLDHLDEMYALPESVRGLADGVGMFLQTLLAPSGAGGAPSAAPPFLRGVYLTSALRTGQALDVELKRAFGLAELPLSRRAGSERAFFLRDLMLDKIFPEAGMVAPLEDVIRAGRRRSNVLLATAVGVAAAIVVGSTVGFVQIAGPVRRHTSYWGDVARAAPAGLPLFEAGEYRGDQPALPPDAAPAPAAEAETRLALHRRGVDLYDQSFASPLLPASPELDRERRALQQRLFARFALLPSLVPPPPRADAWTDAAAKDAADARLAYDWAGGARGDGQRATADPKEAVKIATSVASRHPGGPAAANLAALYAAGTGLVSAPELIPADEVRRQTLGWFAAMLASRGERVRADAADLWAKIDAVRKAADAERQLLADAERQLRAADRRPPAADELARLSNLASLGSLRSADDLRRSIKEAFASAEAVVARVPADDPALAGEREAYARRVADLRRDVLAALLAAAEGKSAAPAAPADDAHIGKALDVLDRRWLGTGGDRAPAAVRLNAYRAAANFAATLRQRAEAHTGFAGTLAFTNIAAALGDADERWQAFRGQPDVAPLDSAARSAAGPSEPDAAAWRLVEAVGKQAVADAKSESVRAALAAKGMLDALDEKASIGLPVEAGSGSIVRRMVVPDALRPETLRAWSAALDAAEGSLGTKAAELAEAQQRFAKWAERYEGEWSRAATAFLEPNWEPGERRWSDVAPRVTTASVDAAEGELQRNADAIAAALNELGQCRRLPEAAPRVEALRGGLAGDPQLAKGVRDLVARLRRDPDAGADAIRLAALRDGAAFDKALAECEPRPVSASNQSRFWVALRQGIVGGLVEENRPLAREKRAVVDARTRDRFPLVAAGQRPLTKDDLDAAISALDWLAPEAAGSMAHPEALQLRDLRASAAWVQYQRWIRDFAAGLEAAKSAKWTLTLTKPNNRGSWTNVRLTPADLPAAPAKLQSVRGSKATLALEEDKSRGVLARLYDDSEGQQQREVGRVDKLAEPWAAWRLALEGGEAKVPYTMPDPTNPNLRIDSEVAVRLDLGGAARPPRSPFTVTPEPEAK